MNVRILIDGIVRQTTVLIAQLATSGGLRAPLAHVAGQVFLELAKELESQGVTKKVTADMFGMALRTYQRRTQRLSQSVTDRGRSLWEALLDYIEREGPVTREEVLRRFRHDDEASLRGVLRDLTESGVAKRSFDGSVGSGGAGGPGGAALSHLCKTINDDSGDTDASTLVSILGAAASSCDIEPSSYDQSCKVDADCTAVGFGNLCEVPCAVQCANAAINVRDLATYNADYAKNPAAVCGPFFCGCPAEGNPVCRGGTCVLRFQIASTDGGGTNPSSCATCGGSPCCSGTCINDRCSQARQ